MDQQAIIPFFSVIMPVYNRENMLRKAIESVLVQEWQQWELIIIDDGSTDNSAEVVRSFLSDSRIYYVYQENQERSIARNNGIDHANGRFICFIDSDDYYLPNHLQVLHDSILKHDFLSALYYTSYYLEMDNERKLPKGFSAIRNKGIFNLMHEDLLQTNSVCIEASLLKADRFPPQFNLFEDNHLWFRIIAKTSLVYIPIPTTVMCDHNERSLYVSREEFKRKVEKYESVLNDLFFAEKFMEIDRLISPFEKRKFMSAKLLVLCYEAMKLGILKTSYHLLFRSLKLHTDKTRIAEYLKLFFGIPVFITFMRKR